MAQVRSWYNCWDNSNGFMQPPTKVNQKSLWIPPASSSSSSESYSPTHMKRSSAPLDNVPQCALNQQDVSNTHARSKNDSFGKTFSRFPASRGSGSSNLQNVQRQVKQEPVYSGTQEWPSTYDNSNTSWDGDWITPGSSFKPSSSGGFYKQRSTTVSYQSSSNDWSTGDSSTSNSVPSGYAGMQTVQPPVSNSLSASSSSYYENANFYSGNYNYDSNVGGYAQSSYRSSHQTQQYHPAVRPTDPVPGSFNGNRNPSSCPPAPSKESVPDYNQKNSQSEMDDLCDKATIKKEPDEFIESENFSSVFTRSLTSLYSEDPFRVDINDPDVIVCSPPPSINNMDEQQTNYPRHVPPAAPYHNNSPNFANTRGSSFGFYDNRNQNNESMSDVLELGSENEKTNEFRYDRPSFDDMHLYASSNDPKIQSKKRKVSMPDNTPEGNFGADNRRKAPRMSAFKSDSQWTPNSFTFNNIKIKQEPEDDYSSQENENQNNSKLPSKDYPTSNNGSCGTKSPSQPDHPKPVPRKRSPATTCFDRFEKKSTPTNKKVSPLSVYAKVQDGIVLNVKCRRYKKRTKPVVTKEEVVYPGREEIENWKRTGAYSQTPDHAVRILMGDLLERISQVDGKNVTTGPDLNQLNPAKIRELIFQFCQRYSVDFRDFEDINSVLKPCIIKDKTAKNSERASAIQKRTSTSPVHQENERELISKTPKVEKIAKKSSNENLKSASKRVLRNLPGREHLPEPMQIEIRPSSRSRNKILDVKRRYSTRSGRDTDGKNSDVDIIIDSSTDRESEAGKEAEVRKKSERLKNKQPVVEMPAKDKTSEKLTNSSKNTKEKSRTRSKDKVREREKSKDKLGANHEKRWSREHNTRGFLRSASIEIVDITRSDSSSLSDLSKDVSESESSTRKSVRTENKRGRKSSASSSRETSHRSTEKDSNFVSSKKSSRNRNKKVSENQETPLKNESGLKIKKEILLSEENVKKAEVIAKESDKNLKHKVNIKEESNSKVNVEQSHDNDSVSKQKRGAQALKDNNFIEQANSSTSTKKRENENLKKSEKSSNSVLAVTCKDDSKVKNELKCQSDLDLKDVSQEQRKTDISRTKKVSSNPKHSDKHTPKKNNVNIFTRKEHKSPQTSSKESDDNKNFLQKNKACSKSNELSKSSKGTIKKENLTVDNKNVASSINESNSKACKNIIGKESSQAQNPNDLTKIISKVSGGSPSEQNSKLLDSAKRKRRKLVQVAVNRPNVIENAKNTLKGKTSKANVEPESQISSPKKTTKKETNEKHSLCSESELQVVLMKLPEAHLRSFVNSLQLQYFERCVSEKENKYFAAEENRRNSDDSSSVGSPPELVCMKEIDKESDIKMLDSSSKENLENKDDQTTMPVIHCDEPIHSEIVKITPKHKPLPITEPRYSADSEDSDCRLVIDLDRRMSVDEDISAPVLNHSEDERNKILQHESVIKPPPNSVASSEEASKKCIKTTTLLPLDNQCSEQKEKNKVELDSKQAVEVPFVENSSVIITPDQVENIKSETSSLKMVVSLPKIEDVLKDTKTNITEAVNLNSVKEEPISNEINVSVIKTENFTPCKTSGSDNQDAMTNESLLSVPEDCQSTNSGQQLRVESILRSLLLERPNDGNSNLSQPSTSSVLTKAKGRFPEDFRKLVLKQARQGALSSDSVILDAQALSQEVEVVFEDMKLALDQLPEINSALLSNSEEWVYDSKILKDKLMRLRQEIMYLQYVAYQREREKIGLLSLKRSSSGDPNSDQNEEMEKNTTLNQDPNNYMDEVLRSLLKQPCHDHLKIDQHKSGEASSSKQSDVLKCAETNDIEPNNLLSRHLLQMAAVALSIARTGVATAILANQRRPVASSGEQLPSVETMVASASENYGVDISIEQNTKLAVSNQNSDSKVSSVQDLEGCPTSESDVEVQNTKKSNLKDTEASVKKLKKKIPSCGESPFKPFCSSSPSKQKVFEGPSRPTILQKALSKDSLNSQSSSQKSLTQQSTDKILSIVPPSSPSTSSQENYPLDFSIEKQKSSSIPKLSDIPSAFNKSPLEKTKSSGKSSHKHQSKSSYSVWKKMHASKIQTSSTLIDVRVDHAKTQETTTITRTTSAILSSSVPSSSNPNIMIRPTSVNHSIISPNPISTIIHHQRSETTKRLLTSSNHLSMASEIVPGSSFQERIENINPDEQFTRNNHDQITSRNDKDERQPLSYSSLITSNNTLSHGVIAQNFTPSMAITKPPGVATPISSPFRCNGCGLPYAKFLCSGCRDHRYCSAECQNIRWPEHRLICPGNLYSVDSSYSQNSFNSDQ